MTQSNNAPEQGEDLDEEFVKVTAATEALVGKPIGQIPANGLLLDNLFFFAQENWRHWKGEKPKGDALCRIHAILRQAVQGDCPPGVETKFSSLFEKDVIQLWCKYRGTLPETAKRRFLTLLRALDPSLLVPVAYTFIPDKFPAAEDSGCTICPFSNSVGGCPRPLLDGNGLPLKTSLESCTTPASVRAWVETTVKMQQCSLGRHSCTPHGTAAAFKSFFSRPECKGYRQFKPEAVQHLLKKLLAQQTDDLIAMYAYYSGEGGEARRYLLMLRERVCAMEQCYLDLTGKEYLHETLCEKNDNRCEMRRLADGGVNHTHPVVITPPDIDLSDFDPVIRLRRECERLGISPRTGTIATMEERMLILQQRIDEYHQRRARAAEANRRNMRRAELAPVHALEVKIFSLRQSDQALQRACIAGDLDLVCSLVEARRDRGHHSDVQTWWGIFPLMLAVLRGSVAAAQRLAKARVNVDYCNSRGMTALSWAARRGDLVMTHCLLKLGAKPEFVGRTGLTAAHEAARCGRDEVLEMLVDSARKVGGEPAARRLLDSRGGSGSQAGGMTPLMFAASGGNEFMVRKLCRAGANPALKDYRGRTASQYAVNYGRPALAKWLNNTRAVGGDGLFTYSDQQREEKLRQAQEELSNAIDNVALGGSQKPLDIIRGMLAAPDTETFEGHTALLTSCFRGEEDEVQVLLRAGCGAGYANRNDRTPLMSAASAGREGVVRILLAAGADSSIADVKGRTASLYAAGNGHAALSKWLAIAADHGAAAGLRAWQANDEADALQLEHSSSAKQDGRSAEAILIAPDTDLLQWGREVRTENKFPRRFAGTGGIFLGESLSLSLTAGSLCDSSWASSSTGAGGGAAPRKPPRCPRCTLPVPCCHFSSTYEFGNAYPDGAPEWRWGRARARPGPGPGPGPVFPTCDDPHGGGIPSPLLGGQPPAPPKPSSSLSPPPRFDFKSMYKQYRMTQRRRRYDDFDADPYESVFFGGEWEWARTPEPAAAPLRRCSAYYDVS
jgi:ankyrin repeat protein